MQIWVLRFLFYTKQCDDPVDIYIILGSQFKKEDISLNAV